MWELLIDILELFARLWRRRSGARKSRRDTARRAAERAGRNRALADEDEYEAVHEEPRRMEASRY